jgi:hypothetical protein
VSDTALTSVSAVPQVTRRTPVTKLIASDSWTIFFAANVVVGTAALVAFIGADARWLAALGGVIWRHQTIPAGIPFASAPSAHWNNTIVLAEMLFRALESGAGDRGLMLAQLTAALIAILVLARDALAGGASRHGTTAALLLAGFGALAELSVARAQLFSIALFPLAAALLRSEARSPSWRIWLVVPLIALWSNLHGAVLIGLGMTLVYLMFMRVREAPRTALSVAMAALIASCMTPAGIHTIAYYHGVLTNEAAQHGQGLWAPLTLRSPLDFLLVASAMALAAHLRRSGAELWELLILGVLGVLTVTTSRSGVWLLFFLVPLAARTFKTRDLWDHLLPPLGAVAVVVLLFAVLRGPLPSGASGSVVTRAITLSRGAPVLAEDIFAEQIALDGGRIWIGNPIDAFSKRDQLAYLDWLQGQRTAWRTIGVHIRVVLTSPGSPANRLMRRDPNFRLIASDRSTALYLRR